VKTLTDIISLYSSEVSMSVNSYRGIDYYSEGTNWGEVVLFKNISSCSLVLV
jgi:hypothetical protein